MKTTRFIALLVALFGIAHAQQSESFVPNYDDQGRQLYIA